MSRPRRRSNAMQNNSHANRPLSIDPTSGQSGANSFQYQHIRQQGNLPPTNGFTYHDAHHDEFGCLVSTQPIPQHGHRQSIEGITNGVQVAGLGPSQQILQRGNTHPTNGFANGQLGTSSNGQIDLGDKPGAFVASGPRPTEQQFLVQAYENAAPPLQLTLQPFPSQAQNNMPPPPQTMPQQLQHQAHNNVQRPWSPLNDHTDRNDRRGGNVTPPPQTVSDKNDAIAHRSAEQRKLDKELKKAILAGFEEVKLWHAGQMNKLEISHSDEVTRLVQSQREEKDNAVEEEKKKSRDKIKALEDDVKRLKEEKESLDKKVSDTGHELDNAKARKLALDKELESAKLDSQQKTKELADQQFQVGELNGQIEELAKSKINLEAERDEARRNAETLKGTIEECEEAATIATNRFEASLKVATAEKDSSLENLSKGTQLSAANAAKYETAAAEVKELRTQLQAAEANETTSADNYRKLESKYKESRKILDKLQDEHNNCASEAKEKANSVQLQLNNNTTMINRLKSDLTKAHKDMTEVDARKTTKLTQMITELAEKDESLKIAQRSESEMQGRLKEKTEELTTMRTSIDAELQAKDKSCKELQEQLSNAQAKHQESKEELETIRAEVEKIRAERDQAQRELDEIYAGADRARERRSRHAQQIVEQTPTRQFPSPISPPQGNHQPFRQDLSMPSVAELDEQTPPIPTPNNTAPQQLRKSVEDLIAEHDAKEATQTESSGDPRSITEEGEIESDAILFDTESPPTVQEAQAEAENVLAKLQPALGQAAAAAAEAQNSGFDRPRIHFLLKPVPTGPKAMKGTDEPPKRKRGRPPTGEKSSNKLIRKR